MFDPSKILDLINAYSELIGPGCFLVAFLGSLLGFNLLVPTGTLLAGIGVLVGAGAIAWTVVIWAALGAATGSSASYTAGIWLGPSVRSLSAWRSWSRVMERAQVLFRRYGFASILIAYFSGPLRAPVAAVAAIAGMRRIEFELANLSSAFVWATVAVGVGAVPGSMIEPNSPWLVVAPFLVPLLVIGISLAITLGWKATARSRAKPPSPPT